MAFSASGLFANTRCVVMMEVTIVGGRSVLGRCSTGAEEPTGASRGSELREEGMVPARVKNREWNAIGSPAIMAARPLRSCHCHLPHLHHAEPAAAAASGGCRDPVHSCREEPATVCPCL